MIILGILLALSVLANLFQGYWAVMAGEKIHTLQRILMENRAKFGDWKWGLIKRIMCKYPIKKYEQFKSHEPAA